MASSDKDRIRELEATVRLLAHRVSQLESAGASAAFSAAAAGAAAVPPAASPAYANSITSKKVGGLYSPPATPPGAGSTAAPAAAAAAATGSRPAYDFGATPAAARVSPALKASGGGDDPFASMLDTPHHRKEESRFVAPVVSSSAGAAAAPAIDAAAAAAAPMYDDGAIAAGMRIRILSDREEVMRSCELSTVGWRASKEAMLGKTGTVTEVDAQAARVRLNGGQECWFPKPVLTPIPALHSPPGSRHDDGGSVGEANAQLLLRYSAANAHAAHATAADESLTSAHRVLARARDRSPTPPPPAASAAAAVMREAMVGRGFSPPQPAGSGGGGGGGVASRRASGVSAGVVGPAASPARSGRALPAHVSSVAALRSFPHSDAAAASAAAAAAAVTPARRFSYTHAAADEGVPAYSSVAAPAAGVPRVLEAPAAAAAAAARRASVAEAAAYDAALSSAVRPSAVVATPVGGGGATPGGGSVRVTSALAGLQRALQDLSGGTAV